MVLRQSASNKTEWYKLGFRQQHVIQEVGRPSNDMRGETSLMVVGPSLQLDSVGAEEILKFKVFR